MAITRNYNYEESTRPKLSRNIYDYIYDSKSESNSVFASTGGGYTNITQVGGDMASISEFVGAINGTSTVPGQNGERGLVPAPLIGDATKFLQGSGGWVKIPAFEWLQEFPSNSSNKTGLTINGDFNVSHTLSAQTLRIEGAAHFWSLLIDETKASGGQIYISPALFEVDYVDNSITQYAVSSTPVQTILTQRSDWQTIFTENNVTHIYTQRAYMRCDDNERRTRNECEIGDMMRCHTWNLDGIYAGQTYNNIGNKDYWTFVVNKSNSYVWYNTDTGNESSSTPSDTTGWVKVFWIDLACQIKTSSGTLNFGSTVTWSGDINDNNQNQTTDVDLTELIKQAKRTYNGTTTTSDISPTTGTPSDYTSMIVGAIYGAADLVQSVSGSSSTRSISTNSDEIDSFDLAQMQSALNKIANGTTDSFIDGLDEANMSSLILDETIDTTEIPSEQDLDDAEDISFAILGQPVTATPLYSDAEAATLTSDAMSNSPMRAAASGSNSQAYWYFGYGTFNLEVGDQLAAFGHVFNGNRMDAIVISAISPLDTTLTAPAIAQYAGINEFGSQLEKFRTSVLAANGNYLQGSFKVVNDGTLIDVNERINLMINDINTGLAKVGIFLDGDNSQIKLVGSVEIRQHDTNDYDTLTVWDSNSNKKVEITPKAITSLSSISSIPMEQNYSLSQANYSHTWYSSNISTTTSWNFGLNNDDQIYTLNNATNTFTISSTIGTLAAGDTLSIGGGNWTLDCPITFDGRNGSVPVSTRTGQQISSFMMYIKRNGSTISSATVDLKSNSRYSGYMPTGSNLTTDSIVISIPTNIYASSQTMTITSSGTYQPGTYSVEFVIGLKYGAVYTDARAGDRNRISNPTMKTTSSFSGTVNATITKASPTFMQIGNNGLAFSMGANKLMYASDSAMKMNWKSSSWANTNSEGVGISFNDSYGMQIIKNVKSYTPSGTSVTIDNYVDVAIVNLSGKSSATITLPRAGSDYYGNGRILEIVTINNSSLNLWGTYNTYQPNWPITINSTSSTVVEKRRTVEVRTSDSENGYTNMVGINWDGTFKFISSGSTWYEI